MVKEVSDLVKIRTRSQLGVHGRSSRSEDMFNRDGAAVCIAHSRASQGARACRRNSEHGSKCCVYRNPFPLLVLAGFCGRMPWAFWAVGHFRPRPSTKSL